jgi:hypothetical protein
MPLPYKEPSQTLYQLFNTIVEEGRRFANTADLQISDMSAQAPVGTTLAILERTLKTMSAVQARIHYSMKQELRLLKEIIASYTPDEYSYEPVEGHRYAKRADYDDIAVIPVSDPNASTMAQKIVQYQAVFQLAQQAPNLFNMPLLYRQMLDVIGIKEAEKLVPMDEDQKPADPITENQNVLMGKPVKAFAYQDHKAHITVHMMAMQDPKIQQLLQNNPMAQSMQAAMMNHINDHMGMEYRKEIELQLGFNLPATEDESGDDIHINPEVEARLAPLLAQAAQRLFQKNSGEAAQAQAQTSCAGSNCADAASRASNQGGRATTQSGQGPDRCATQNATTANRSSTDHSANTNSKRKNGNRKTHGRITNSCRNAGRQRKRSYAHWCRAGQAAFKSSSPARHAKTKRTINGCT